MNETHIYETFDEMIRKCESKVGTHSPSSENDSRNSEWDLNTNREQAFRYAKEGWSEDRPGVESLLEELDMTLAESVIPAMTPTIGLVGESVDLTLFTTGVPECVIGWELTQENAGTREVVRIVVSVSTPCSSDASIIRRRGIAICALLDLISRSGRSVELWADGSVAKDSSKRTRENGGSIYSTQVCVKRADSYLDVDQIMFAIAHPAMLRRIMFAEWEHNTDEIRKHWGFGNSLGCYGYPADPDPAGFTLTIDAMKDTREFRTIEGCVGWIRKQLKDLRLLKEEG